jgi:phosphoribosylanthranilate isomerase
MTRIKICGLTSREDALRCVEAGADALGFVFAKSSRRVTPADAARIVRELPPLVSTVGVFLNERPEQITTIAQSVGLDAVQLHGDESSEDCLRLPLKVIKRFNILENDTPDLLRARIERYRVSANLLDPGAGSGKTFHWELARGLPGPLIVSGGLTPENVGQAIRTLRPYAVDVASGVESEPGRKDPERLSAFIQAVRKADADSGHA